MFCKRACAGVLVSAVWVVSTPELVGVHAKGGGKRFRVCRGTQSGRQTMRRKRKEVAGEWGRRRSVFYILREMA